MEYRVAALDLVALLCCVPVPGLEVVPDAVELQKASTAPLDDVVVSNGMGPYLLVVERQIKRTLDIAPSAKAWRGLIGPCLESLERFGDDVDAERRRFGVTATGPSKDLEDLRGLAATASAQASLEKFLQEALPPLGKQYHRVWTHLKTTVADAMTTSGGSAPAPELVELTAFRIVRRLVVQIEPEGPGARYTALCAALEERLIPAGADNDAATVFGIVADLAEEWGPHRGSVDREMLRNRLSAKGLVLRGDPPARRELEAVERWTDGFLSQSRVKDQLDASLCLDRAALRAELAGIIEVHKLVLVTGPAGTGKSALTRAVAKELRQPDQVTVVGLSLTEHTWRTVADIDGALGGPGRLDTALCGAPTGRRVLVIDGAEQALSDNGRLLTHLLSLLPRDEEGEPLWHVVAVAREQAADAVSRCLTARGGQAEKMLVNDLTDAELREVLDAFPALVPMARLPRPARLLRTLYTVDLIVRLLGVGADPQQIVGEEDVAHCVYDHLVRRGEGEHPGLGHPEERSEVYLDLAEAVVGGEQWARLRHGTGTAKDGLVSDGVLVRERSAFGFAHDVMQDYAVAIVLCEPSAPVVTAAPVPRRLLRGVRIAAQLRLTRSGHRRPAQVVLAWSWITDTARRLAEQSDARWLDLPFEALFELGRPESVLPPLADILFDDGGRALVGAACLRMRNVEVAGVLLRFLTRHAGDLDEVAADGALHLLGDWLPKDGEVDEELAAGVPAAVATWFRVGSKKSAAAAIALAATARHLDEAGRGVFERICRNSILALREVVEDKGLAGNMARHVPDLLALAARSFYLGAPAGRDPVYFREGVRDTAWPVAYRPSNIRQWPVLCADPWIPAGAPDPADLGPFAVLLEHAPDQGLALVGQVADAATDAVTCIETERGRREFSLVWSLDQGDKVFAGTARSWQWPWAGAPGPGPGLAALAALRRWAHDQAEAGAVLGELVERVLGCGRSIALVAITVGALALNARRVTDELDPVLGQLDLWELPTSDAVQLEYALPLIVLRAPAERQDGTGRWPAS
ncbi:AAA family ATPase [Streptomyces malaysiensis]|uniref:AAA family ATPase n=1 Tax=Streptomyces malaysiensis TaxID=92644 RepID=UPI003722DFD3